MFRHFIKNKLVANFLVSLVVTLLVALILGIGVFDTIANRLADSLYNRNETSEEIIIVAVDEKSTSPEQFGRFSQWSRDRFTETIRNIEKDNPKALGIDFLFSTYTENIFPEEILEFNREIEQLSSKSEQLEEHESFLANHKNVFNNPIDQRLADELSLHENIVLMADVNFEGNSVVLPIYKFIETTTPGIVKTYLDDDGILRKSIAYFNFGNGEIYDNFSVALVKKYLGKEALELLLEGDSLIVNYFGDPYSYQMISFADVANSNFDEGLFRDKIVLVGITDSRQIHDEQYTPRSNATPMPGIEFRANEIQTILEGKFLANQSKISQIVTIALISLGLTVVLSYLGIILSLLVTAAVIILYILAAHVMYRRGLIINMIYPFIAIVLSYVGSWVYKYFIADRKKRDMTNAFGRYVSKELVQQISENPDQVKLGGENREISVFFSDIKNSTTLSEKIPIEQWVAQINEYFTVMENVLMQSGGTLDKYEGDAIMGFWNAPITQENHVDRAYICALTMKAALANLHQKWQKEDKPLLEFRIGINTGPAIVGNFGSENRLDYTVMGDTINTASRLESSANKAYGTQLCVANGHSDKVILRELDNVLLPGKKETVQIFELVCMADKYDEGTKKLHSKYAEGLAAYRAKNWATAIEAFQAIPSDPPAQVMLARCQQLQAGQAVSGLDQNMVFGIEHK